MTENIVQIEATTHLLVAPERGLQVALRIQSLGECYLTVQVATAAGYMTHQVKVPRFPRDGAFELEEWLDPGQSIDIMASLDGRPYGDDHILFQVIEEASRLVIKEIETETDGIIFQTTIKDPPPLKRRL